ncbi:sigma-54-dependent Fis family transcriptional regulator [Mycolicibacterium sp. 120320]|uniref:sigma-54-dependent Fis family transcriptional regulator n=1 Tax=Mycolicibacterium sp. 120320 TaxID=3096110 RepID=UPI002ED9E9A6
MDARPDVTSSGRAGKGRGPYGLGGGIGMDATHLRALRDRFIADPAGTDLSSLRPVIERSWRRSMMWNIDPDRRTFEDIHEPEIDDLVLRCAEPVLGELERLAADSGAHVILADPSGTVAVFRGEPQVRRVAERLFPTFGGAMSEDVAGTNAEGTAIEEGAAVQIWGPEHFVASLEDFCCTSVPIYDPLRRAVRGFLSLSLPADVGMDVNPASIAWIVKGAAAEVSRRLAEGLAVREKSLLDSYLSEVRKRGSESVVVMDSRMTIATRGALEMLQPADYAVLAGYARESEQTSRPVEREVMLEPERALHLRASPISSGGETIGSVIRLKPLAPIMAIRAGASPSTTRRDPFEAVIGESVALRRAVEVASSAVRRRLPTCIIGEPGTGKLTLATSMASMMAEETVVLDCARPELNEQDCLDDITSALLRQASVVLCHADALSAEACAALAELLATHDNPAVVITLAGIGEDTMALTSALGGIEIAMPTLRQRRDDIPLLAAHFMRRGPHGNTRISRTLLRVLTEADWPGNVAQLHEFVTSAAVRCASPELGMEHLSDTHRRALAKSRLSRLEEVELRQIQDALAEAGGNRLQAAKLLQIGRSTLYRKIEFYTRRGFTLD